MDSLVDEDDVVTSSGDRRDTENSNEAIIFSRKNLDRVSTPVTSLSNVRDANRLVFTSVSSSPSSSSGTAIKHGSISTQAIALSQAGGGVSIVQLQLPNQTNVVQSVIQPAHQQSVIQATGGAATVQTVQIPKNVIFQLNKMGSNSVIQSTENTDLNQVLISTFDRPEASDNSIITSPPPPPPPLSSTSLAGSTTVTSVSSAEDESKKRREVLERRPSYRKIFNELSSADLGSLTSPSIKSEDETDSESSTATIVAGVASPYLKVLPTSTIQLAQSQDGTVQGLQTLTMANAGSGGSTILQYAQGQDGQFFVPGKPIIKLTIVNSFLFNCPTINPVLLPNQNSFPALLFMVHIIPALNCR